jgi:hypothetical protein
VKRADFLLFPLVKDLGIESSMRLMEIKKNWHNLFNEPLSSHMSPCKLFEGEMLLNVDSPVWLQELNYLKKDIIEKLSPYGIRDIRLKLGKVSKRIESEGSSKGMRIKKLTPEELSYIDKTASQIDDEELRETVIKTIEKAITSNRIKVRF